MKKVKAIIEKAPDGSFSIYMDASEMDYLVTGTGDTIEEAKKMFAGGYEDMKRVCAEKGRSLEEVEFEYVFGKDTMRTYTLDELTDKYIGEKGTPRRDKFDADLKDEIQAYLKANPLEK